MFIGGRKALSGGPTAILIAILFLMEAAAPAQSFRELAGLPPVDEKWLEYCRPRVAGWAASEGYDLATTRSPNLTMTHLCQNADGGDAADFAEKERRLRRNVVQLLAERSTGPAELMLVSSPDIASFYPKGSIRDGEDGVTQVRCTLNGSGQPQDCTVTRSSGFDRLDKAAVAFIRRQVYGASGHASVAGMVFERPVRWVLD